MAKLIAEKKGVGSELALANNLAVGAGIIFSTLLILLFAPVAAVHSDALRNALNREEKEASENNKAFDFTGRLRQLGLDSDNTFGSLAHLIAIFAPLGLGIMTKLLDLGSK